MLINPSNLYSGGNVKFDSSPYVRMAQQQRARQQALDEASMQYFSKLPDKLNTAGIMANDLHDDQFGGIQDDVDNWRQKTTLNIREIAKGGRAQSDAMAELNVIKNNISLAKQKAAGLLKVGAETMKPNGWRLNEDDVEILSAMSKPIKDPTSRKQDQVSLYSIGDLSPNIPDFDANYQLKHNKAIEGGILPEKDPNDKGLIDPQGLKITYNYGYSPENVKRMADKAQGYASIKNTRERKEYMGLIKVPEQNERARLALQKEYDQEVGDGKLVVIDTAEEMARGLALDKYSNLKKPHEVTDRKAIMDWQNQQQEKRFANARAMAKKREEGKDKRLALLTKFKIPDIYGEIEAGEDIVMQMPDGNNVTLKEVPQSMSEADNEDFAGKKDKYGSRDYKYIELGGKKYVKKTDYGLLDANNKPFDQDATIAKKYTRLNQSKKAQVQGKMEVGNKPTGQQAAPNTAPKKRKFD